VTDTDDSSLYAYYDDDFHVLRPRSKLDRNCEVWDAEAGEDDPMISLPEKVVDALVAGDAMNLALSKIKRSLERARQDGEEVGKLNMQAQFRSLLGVPSSGAITQLYERIEKDQSWVENQLDDLRRR
jgi:hypothetical protein